MKPKRIFLVRHGQSQGNEDSSMYEHTPDYALRLTEKGKADALQAGLTIAELAGYPPKEQFMFYVSPLYRTRDTFTGIAHGMNLYPTDLKFQEEPRLREQEFGHMRSIAESKVILEDRDKYGTFYFRIPDGESGADVYDRVASFFGSIHRDFEKPDFPENVVIVTHGMTIRLFLMKWFHWSVEQFEEIHNPYNGQVFEMRLNDKNKYDLITPVRKYEPVVRPFPYV